MTVTQMTFENHLIHSESVYTTYNRESGFLAEDACKGEVGVTQQGTQLLISKGFPEDKLGSLSDVGNILINNIYKYNCIMSTV